MTHHSFDNMPHAQQVAAGVAGAVNPPCPLTRLALLLLTWVAGWVDALCFLGLGKVFTSFMSGNFLFLGIALGQGDWEFLLRAAAALTAFLAGAVAAALGVSRSRRPPGALSVAVLAAETAVLLGFAVGWWSLENSGPGHATPVILLAMAAFAMGLQAATVMALNIPGVATNALTGTYTLIARILARRAQGAPTPREVSLVYLMLLCTTYGLSAGTVVFAIGWKASIFLPVILLASAALIAGRQDRAWRALEGADGD